MVGGEEEDRGTDDGMQRRIRRWCNGDDWDGDGGEMCVPEKQQERRIKEDRRGASAEVRGRFVTTERAALVFSVKLCVLCEACVCVRSRVCKISRFR